MLPDGSGLHVARELAHAGHRAAVLKLTARDSVADPVAAFAVGADDYLVKPLAFAMLLARLGALRRREPPVYSRRFQVLRAVDDDLLAALEADRDAFGKQRWVGKDMRPGQAIV